MSAIVTEEHFRRHWVSVNQLATSALQRKFAQRLFEKWGVEPRHAETLTDSIADWIDGNSDPLPNGAENSFYAGVDYPQFPPNADFTSLEQLAFVSGMDEVEKIQPFWRDYFTIRSDALIDFNAASVCSIATPPVDVYVSGSWRPLSTSSKRDNAQKSRRSLW